LGGQRGGFSGIKRRTIATAIDLRRCKTEGEKTGDCERKQRRFNKGECFPKRSREGKNGQTVKGRESYPVLEAFILRQGKDGKGLGREKEGQEQKGNNEKEEKKFVGGGLSAKGSSRTENRGRIQLEKKKGLK